MPKFYACNANIPAGEPITPINRKRIQQGRYYVPDCADYESKFGLPKRVKLKEVYAGWSCYNCVHLMESTTPFDGPKHTVYTAQLATPEVQPVTPGASASAAKKA